MIATHCAICRRRLTNPASVAIGIGPICSRRMKSAEAGGEQDQFADEPLMAQALFPNIILQRSEDGHVRTNVPHIVVEHSPTGFLWGYSGSGPSDLALNICEAILAMQGYKGKRIRCYRGTCFQVAWDLHPIFREEFLAKMPHEGGMIPYEQAQSWITAQMQRTFFRSVV